jgi:hypothetical protein
VTGAAEAFPEKPTFTGPVEIGTDETGADA